MALLENGPFFRMMEHCTLGLLGLSLCLLLPATLAVLLLCYFTLGADCISSVYRADLSIENAREAVVKTMRLAYLLLALHVLVGEECTIGRAFVAIPHIPADHFLIATSWRSLGVLELWKKAVSPSKVANRARPA